MGNQVQGTVQCIMQQKLIVMNVIFSALHIHNKRQNFFPSKIFSMGNFRQFSPSHLIPMKNTVPSSKTLLLTSPLEKMHTVHSCPAIQNSTYLAIARARFISSPNCQNVSGVRFIAETLFVGVVTLDVTFLK